MKILKVEIYECSCCPYLITEGGFLNPKLVCKKFKMYDDSFQAEKSLFSRCLLPEEKENIIEDKK